MEQLCRVEEADSSRAVSSDDVRFSFKLSPVTKKVDIFFAFLPEMETSPNVFTFHSRELNEC